MNDGYWALIISIFREVTPENAFKLLYGEDVRQNKTLTIEDLKEIKTLREQGEKWETIGAIYGVKWKTAQMAYSRNLRYGTI